MVLEEALALIEVLQQTYGADTLGEAEVILKLHWDTIVKQVKERH